MAVSKDGVFGRAPQSSKRLCRQAPFEGKSRKTNGLAAWGTFCKRKSSQLTTDSHNPEKPPTGRFFCCRTIKPSERKTAQRLFRRSAAGDSEAPLLPPRGTAKRLSCPHREQRSVFPGGMMPHPIRVSVAYKIQPPTSRHHACEIKFSLTCFHENLNRMADSCKIKQKKCPLRKVEGFSMRRGWKCGRFFVRLKVKRKGGSEWISSKSDDLSPPSENVRD